jgi:hypothetical protein
LHNADLSKTSRLSSGIQQDIQAWCSVVIGFDQDVQIAIGVEVAQSAFVNPLATRDDLLPEIALAIPVPDDRPGPAASLCGSR